LKKCGCLPLQANQFQTNLGHSSQHVTERCAKAVAALRTTDADKTAAIICLPIEKSQTNSQMLGVALTDASGASIR
jgi:hypothetical protein